MRTFKTSRSKHAAALPFMWRIITLFIAGIVAILVAVFGPGSREWVKSETKDMTPLAAGSYQDKVSGFTFQIPDAAAGWAGPVEKDNGVKIILGYHRMIMIYVGKPDENPACDVKDLKGFPSLTLAGSTAYQTRWEEDRARYRRVFQCVDGRDDEILLITNPTHMADDNTTFDAMLKTFTRNKS